MKLGTPELIGWREWVSLPQLGIPAIKAKIDSGARTSSIHAFFVETKEVNGIEVARFGIHPVRKRTDIELICEAPIIDKRIVTDSGGHSEMRYVIKTSLTVGSHQWPIEVTLASRENMLFRFLIGRTALTGRFIIDPHRSFIYGRSLRRKYKQLT